MGALSRGLAAGVAVLILLGSCGSDSTDSDVERDTLPTGSSVLTLTVQGLERTARLYRPTGTRGSTDIPLVVMLHGALGSGRQAERSYEWNAMADQGGFVIAYPDGQNRAWTVSDGCCGPPARDGVDDVAFITALVSEISARTPVDPARVYATGISNGGMLAYRLACDTSLFAAIGPVVATQLGACPEPHPTSIIHIHGTADQTVPYDGGPGRLEDIPSWLGPVELDGPPIPELVTQWRMVNDCGEPARSTAGQVVTSTATCPHGRAVQLITVKGAGHQWPGASGPGRRAERRLGLDPPAPAPDATETIWRFFAEHPGPAGA